MKSFLITLGICSLSLSTATSLGSNLNYSIGQKSQEADLVKVNISAFDENNKELMEYHYQTKVHTLGELMEQYNDNYLLKDFGKDLGLYLYGINYYDAFGEKHSKLEIPNQTFWAFWYLDNQGKEQMSSVGISNYDLIQPTENIIWHYTNI